MKKNDIMSKLGVTFNKACFSVQKHSPEILIVAGIAGTVVSTVLACRSTLKIDSVLEESKDKLYKIKNVHNGEIALAEGQEYTEQDYKRDLTLTYVKMGLDLAKLYAPAVILGSLSITSILVSNNILRKRNMALVAAYTTVDRAFKDYRSRVVERFGDKVDKELRYNVKSKKFEETVVDENGKEKKVKKTVDVADPLACYSQYARIFDESSRNWEKDAEYNLMFLRSQQQYANNLLVAKGHLFLNEVYDMLDIPRTKAGQIVGWSYDKKNPTGDNYVDFGIYRQDVEKACDFVNGYERSIILDFNVDGPIIDSIQD